MGPRSRRQLLHATGLVTAIGLTSACSSSDTTDRYGDEASGYVSGNGVTTEIALQDRTEPLEFSGTTYDGEVFDSVEQRGSILVVNVWYASCPPCRIEAPELQAINEEYADRGVAFVGINLRDDAGPAQAFEDKYGITYPSIPDQQSEVMYQLRGHVAPNAVPTTLVLDRSGRVAGRISGAIDPSILRAMLDGVIDEPAS
ncbi:MULTISPECIES: TlpA family protein disulfide reductase [Brachybacterium]|uniref:TlpA family protein disulfide reductase n=1 Tax=Brachybacterium rhamnosum TaxID=173361 RepID=A0ABW4Q0G7_9MICO|nr:TlpA disulfide reductase family protein [Brachybacterium squillarum]MCW1804479.1 TlpA family protein disulfide reductase [Brachybacterium squillarum]